MKTRQLLPLFVALVITGCGLFKSADDLFSKAEIKRNNGDSAAALELLSTIVEKHAEHEKAPKAQYLIAEIYYRDMRDFSKAIDEYENLRTLYPNSKQVPFSLFMQGFIQANMLANFNQARANYSMFLEEYPEHELYQSVKFELKYLGKEIKEIPELKHLTQ